MKDITYRNHKKLGMLSAILILLFLNSCIEPRQNRSEKYDNILGSKNENVGLGIGQGRALLKNPIIITNDYGLEADFDIAEILPAQPVDITTNQFLQGTCEGVTGACYEVRKNANAPLTSSIEGKWGYSPNTKEFLEAHSFYHLKGAVETFQSHLKSGYNSYYSDYNLASPPLIFLSSFPVDLFKANDGGNWARRTSVYGSNQNFTLSLYPYCEEYSNSRFEPADFSLCMGVDPVNKGLKFAQDPSVIYHELGHAFTHIMLNMRNTSLITDKNPPSPDVVSRMTERTQLGQLFYDEAGAIGEGIADYFAYIKGDRSRFGEWALGRFFHSDRPLNEEDGLHANLFSKTSEGRLKYPDYLNYDVYAKDTPVQDVHYAGQIASHYFVALTEHLITDCSFPKDQAKAMVVRIMSETLAHLGDLTTTSSDHSSNGFQQPIYNLVNHSPEHALSWNKTVNPITYRSFFQTFARKMDLIFNTEGLCPIDGGLYSRDRIEKLLDDYGLLLFRTYNNDLNKHTLTNQSVNEFNRANSVLQPKNKLIIDTRANQPNAYVFDDRNTIYTILQNLQQTGQITSLSPEIPSNIPWNGTNDAVVNQGEIVGLTLNIYNNSNSPLGGIQILANDWDHAKYQNGDPRNGRPCSNLGDGFPTNGAADIGGETGTNPGECSYTTRLNGDEPEENLTPVCMLKLNDDGGERYVLQSVFMEENAIDESNCLIQNGHYNDCFVRVIPGADQAFFSKLNPKSNWAETMGVNSDDLIFNVSNIFLLEINTKIPHATEVECRFRARFSNCSDCFHDIENNNDEYYDYEYSGAKPFQILHVHFTIGEKNK